MAVNLITEMQKAFSQSKKFLYKWALIATFFLYSVSILQLHIQGFEKMFSILSSIIFIAYFLFKMVGENEAERGESIRRTAMLQDSIGLAASKSAIALLIQPLHSKKDSQPPYIGNYYASELEKSDKRLLENIYESAFFTVVGAKYTFFVYLASFIMLLITTIVVMYLGISNSWASTFMATLNFVLASDFFVNTFKFHSLWRNCEKILQSAENSIKNDEINNAFMIFTEYSCALAKTPPIPSLIYKYHQKSTNEAWDQCCKP